MTIFESKGRQRVQDEGLWENRIYIVFDGRKKSRANESIRELGSTVFPLGVRLGV